VNKIYFNFAGPGCLSRILIFFHPGSRIPDLKIATKRRGKKFVVLETIILQNLKLFISEQEKKKTCANSMDPGVKKAPDHESGSATLFESKV
jgi:hypothetical protein